MGQRSRRIKSTKGVIVLVCALAACSDQSLADLGQASSGWIAEPAAVTSTPPPSNPGPPLLKAATRARWVNDDLGVPIETEPSLIVRAIVSRSPTGEQILPASRFEIGVVLEDLEFPGVIPDEVTEITSQLIVPASGSLEPGPVVAFGLWKGYAYATSRTVGQIGVLEVDLLGEDIDGTGCESAGPECVEQQVGDRLVARTTDPGGITWTWEEAGLRYRLFLRSAPPEVAEAMIEASVALRAQDLGSPEGR